MRVCTCRGSCKGPENLADGWTCALSEEYRKSMERITQYECEAAMEKEALEWVAIRDRLMRRVAVLEQIGQRLLVAWNNGAFAVEVSVRPDVVDAFTDLRKTLYENPLSLLELRLDQVERGQ